MRVGQSDFKHPTYLPHVLSIFSTKHPLLFCENKVESGVSSIAYQIGLTGFTWIDFFKIKANPVKSSCESNSKIIGSTGIPLFDNIDK